LKRVLVCTPPVIFFSCNARASVGFCYTARPYSDGLNPGGTASMSEFQGQRACDGVMLLAKNNKIK